VTAGGLVPRPTRLEAVEGALVGQPANAATTAAAAAKADDDLGEDVIGDLFASAAYRRQVLPTFTSRAIARAIERAG
jgi:aerobic carbon-monoxide dehydrogenase medium subunit